MSSYAPLRKIRNWIVCCWVVSVLVILGMYQVWTAPIANDRLLRSEVGGADGSSNGLLILLGLLGVIAILALEYFIQQRMVRDLRKYVAWAEEVSNRRSNQPIPKLGSLPLEKTVRLLSLEALHEKLAKGINQLEFRYQQLLDERVRTADALRGMREGIVALDSDLELLLINDAAHDLLEVNGPVRVGKPLVELIRQPQILELVQNVHQSKKAAESVLQIGSKQSRLLRLRVSPLSDPQSDGDIGEDSGVMLLVSDVTRLTKLESMRRDFTANVSHELKTPLAAIQAYAETLLDGDAIDDPEANRRFVEGIAKQADRLSALIHDLLQLAKLDAEPERVALSKVDIIPIVEDVLAEHRPIASARAIDLTLDLQLATTSVWGTEEGVRAIANNLISNAIRYNRDNGFVKVRIAKQQNRTVLSVLDNGVGIAADQHDRVFERFYRVDKARSIDAGGTGLGLAIVKHLIQQMGGSIRLQSKLGEGSNFEVFFSNYQKSALAVDSNGVGFRSES